MHPDGDRPLRSPDPHNSNGGSSSSFESKEPKAYSFSGKVVLGVGLILAAAAGSTIVAMSLSTSPYIHLSKSTGSSGGLPLAPALVPQSLASPQQHIDKKLVLIQNDFGWNGTTGGPTILVNKGEIVQITVINAGHMAHNFGIAKPSESTLSILKQIENMPLSDRLKNVSYDTMAAMPCPGCHPLFKEGHIDQFMEPDTQQVTTFIANESGDFKYFCMVRGHLWLGMVGDLIVQDVKNADATAATDGSSVVGSKGV